MAEIFGHMRQLRERMERREHFMPASLLTSQFQTLEPLQADEAGHVIDVDRNIDSIIENYVAASESPND